MDKKKIYIAIIVVCVAATVGVFYWSSQDSSSGLPENIGPIATNPDGLIDLPPATGTSAAGALPSAESMTNYPVPRVFPQDPKFDTSVFNSTKFRSLQDYIPLNVTPEEVGRENPFATYQ